MSSGRADLISIMYFALFILEQLKEEVDTMMSGEPGQRWVGELLAHTNTSTNTLRPTHTHTYVNYCMTVHLQRLQTHESSETVVSYLFNSVVVKMSGEAKAVLHTFVSFSYLDRFKVILHTHHGFYSSLVLQLL